jgi:transcriptional regulator of acetoin/glycerol metabolism
VPVLSVNASPLFAQVENGMFSQQLYYRLNTVLEHADPHASSLN